MTLRIGEMRHTAQFQRRSPVKDENGEQQNVWTASVRRQVALERAPGREMVEAGRMAGRVPVGLRLRFVGGLSVGDRVQFACACHASTAPLNVKSIEDPTGRKVELLVVAEEASP